MTNFISQTALSQPFLFYLILIPLIGVIFIIFTNNNQSMVLGVNESILQNQLQQSSFISKEVGQEQLLQNQSKLNDIFIYNIALFFSLLNLLISVIMWYFFNNSTSEYNNVEIGTQFQFIFEISNFNFGIDGISIFFVLLTTFITPIAIFSSYDLFISSAQHSNNSSDTLKLKIFLISLLLLESLQICAFVALDLLLFYIFFESVLPVLFILIVVFGHGENRFRSAFLLFLYTLAGSLPMLLSILTIYSYLDSTDFQLISFNEISLESQK